MSCLLMTEIIKLSNSAKSSGFMLLSMGKATMGQGDI